MNFLRGYEEERPLSSRSSTASSVVHNIDFIPPFSKSYTHRLKLIHQKREAEEQRIQSDPFEGRNYGSSMTIQAPNGARMHHSERTFGLHSIAKHPMNREMEEEILRGRSRNRFSGLGSGNYYSASVSRSRSRDSSVGSVGGSGGGARSRSRSRSPSVVNSRSSSAQSIRSNRSSSTNKFEKQLQMNRDLEAKQKQEEALNKMKKDAYVNYLKSKSSLQQPWIPSGKGPKHDESQHKSINQDAADKLVQRKAWRKAAWPGLLPHEKKNYDGTASRSLDLTVNNNPRKAEELKKKIVSKHTYVNSHEVPLPVEADPATDYKTALPSSGLEGSRSGTGKLKEGDLRESGLTYPSFSASRMQANELNASSTARFSSSNVAPSSPSNSRPSSRNQMRGPSSPGRENSDNHSVTSYRTSSSNTTGRKVILSQVSNHLALTIRMITLLENNATKNSYGILAIRRKCTKADLIAAIEKQFDVFGKISDISIASKQHYSGKITITSLSLGTIEEIPDINDNSDIVVYVGGALQHHFANQPDNITDEANLYTDFLFSQPLRDFRAQSSERERPYQVNNSQSNNTTSSSNAAALLNLEDKLFYHSMVNNVQAFDDYASRESKLTEYYQSRGIAGPSGNTSVASGMMSSDQASRLREYDLKKHAFSTPRAPLGAPKNISVDQILNSTAGGGDLHPAQIHALAESGLIADHPQSQSFVSNRNSNAVPIIPPPSTPTRNVDERIKRDEQEEDALLEEQLTPAYPDFYLKNANLISSPPLPRVVVQDTPLERDEKPPRGFTDDALPLPADNHLPYSEDATTTATVSTINTLTTKGSVAGGGNIGNKPLPVPNAQRVESSRNNNTNTDNPNGNAILPLTLEDIQEVNSISQPNTATSNPATLKDGRDSPFTLSELVQSRRGEEEGKERTNLEKKKIKETKKEEKLSVETSVKQSQEEEEPPAVFVSTPFSTAMTSQVDQLENFYNKIAGKSEKVYHQQPGNHPLGIVKSLSSSASVASMASLRSNSTSKTLNSRRSQSKSPGKAVPLPITQTMKGAEDRFLNRMSTMRPLSDEPHSHLTFQPQFFTSKPPIARGKSSDHQSVGSDPGAASSQDFSRNVAVLPITETMKGAEERYLNRMNTIRSVASSEEPKDHLTFQPQLFTSKSSSPKAVKKSLSFDEPPFILNEPSGRVQELKKKEEKLIQLAQRRNFHIDDLTTIKGKEKEKIVDRYDGQSLLSTPLSPIPIVFEDDDVPFNSSTLVSFENGNVGAGGGGGGGLSIHKIPRDRASARLREDKEDEDTVRMSSPRKDVSVPSRVSMSSDAEDNNSWKAPPKAAPSRSTRQVKEIFLDLRSLLDEM